MPTVHDLPVEVLVMIFGDLENMCHLQVRLDASCSIVGASQVCERWRTVIKENFDHHYFPEQFAGGLCQEMARAIEPLLVEVTDEGAFTAAEDLTRSYITFMRYAGSKVRCDYTFVYPVLRGGRLLTTD